MKVIDFSPFWGLKIDNLAHVTVLVVYTFFDPLFNHPRNARCNIRGKTGTMFKTNLGGIT